MRTRDDFALATTWLISDTHFGHDNIIGFCHRPLDHEQIMIAELRKAVLPGHKLLHLGDLVYRDKGRFKHITSKELPDGDLVKGNHDGEGFNFYRQCGFRLIKPFKLIVLLTAAGVVIAPDGWEAGQDDRTWEISFSHYPWNEEQDGPMPARHLRIHGHIHNNGYTEEAHVPFLRNHVNLSVEQTKFKPVNLQLLLDAVLQGKYPRTTPEQRAERLARKKANLANKEA